LPFAARGDSYGDRLSRLLLAPFCPPWTI